MANADDFITAQKAQVETLFGLTAKAFESLEKVVELNLTASKAALAESADHAKALLSAKDAQELLALQAALLQPLAEKASAYSRHLYDIASSTGGDLGKAYEEQAAEAQRKFLALVDNASRNAPAGSETAVAVLKSAVAAANTAYDSVQKAVKQATEVAEANYSAISSTASSAASKAAATATAAARKR
ncbi:MAG: phasin family protein [Comamonas sp.]